MRNKLLHPRLKSKLRKAARYNNILFTNQIMVLDGRNGF